MTVVVNRPRLGIRLSELERYETKEGGFFTSISLRMKYLTNTTDLFNCTHITDGVSFGKNS